MCEKINPQNKYILTTSYSLKLKTMRKQLLASP